MGISTFTCIRKTELESADYAAANKSRAAFKKNLQKVLPWVMGYQTRIGRERNAK